MGQLDGKVALISGGARGMGESHARLFAAEGAKVVIGDVLTAEGAAVAKDLGEAAIFVELDVTSEEGWKNAVETTLAQFGRLDVLVNNAGVACSCPIEETSLELYRRVTEINQTGVFLGMREVIAPMVAAGGGSIINISSIDGLIGMANVLPYVASKFAVTGMTKTAALELGGRNIRVNSIHPGYIETPMSSSVGVGDDNPEMADFFKQYVASRVPAGRIGQSSDISNLALFLASDASSYCNGSQFVSDGGMIAGEIIPGMS
jgi:3alpha(or 20beta)-hydroxysteroid dehydrogenase